jgi:hypothetical protein
MVEAAGQLFHLFRDGLDYAFIPASFRCMDAGRVIRVVLSHPGPLPLGEGMRQRIPNPSAGSFAACGSESADL